MTEPKVLAAITTTNSIHALCSQTMHEMAKKYDYIDYGTLIGRPTDYIRNTLVRHFLQSEKNYTHLLMIDSDEAIPIDTAERLLKHDVPIATGCYPAMMETDIKWALGLKGNDGHYRLIDYLVDSSAPFWVDAGGAGCLLIKREVFETIEYPWFRWIEYDNGDQMSEDIFFFKKCNEKGIRCLADPNVLVHHFKTMNLLPMMMIREKQRKLKK